MKPIRCLSSLLVLLAACISASTPAKADAGVFTGNGQDLHQISSKDIQLVSIDVTVVLGRGMFLFDGGVAGMDRSEYLCKFVLRNSSEKPEEVQIGFPIDSEFAREDKPITAEESNDWVIEYGFIATDEKDTYHVEYVQRKPTGGESDFGHLFTWKMNFDPKQTRTLIVSYHIPVSMGLVDTGKENGTMSQEKFQEREKVGAFRAEQLDLAMLEGAGYITSTGSSWAGNVETAKFTVITKPFEEYLNLRGIGEETEAVVEARKTSQTESPFPVLHPWWFRVVSPAGWKEIDGGIQWSYSDYKPKEQLAIRYYLTKFPRLPGEVDAFVHGFLKRLNPGDPPAEELTRARDVLLATYGKTPEDSLTRIYVEGQLWYAPRRDFSMDQLTETQKEVLKNLDRRIILARQAK